MECSSEPSITNFMKLRQNVLSLHKQFGETACQELRQLGHADVAKELAAAIQQVANSCYRRLKGAGWDHTAWREAYVLAQLCCAALEGAAASQHQVQLGQGPSALPGNSLTASLLIDSKQMAPLVCRLLSSMLWLRWRLWTWPLFWEPLQS